jgi:hypothetical protein
MEAPFEVGQDPEADATPCKGNRHFRVVKSRISLIYKYLIPLNTLHLDASLLGYEGYDAVCSGE